VAERTLAARPATVIKLGFLPAVGDARCLVAETVFPVRDPPAVVAVDEDGAGLRGDNRERDERAPGGEFDLPEGKAGTICFL
jgi:hypothetical protein